MEKITTPLAYSSSGSLMVFGIGLSDWAVAIGALCAVVTACVNWYYRAAERRDRLQGKVRSRGSD